MPVILYCQRSQPLPFSLHLFQIPLSYPSYVRRPRILTHENCIQSPTNTNPHFPIRQTPIPISTLPDILQHLRPPFLEPFHQRHNARILLGDTIRYGGRDADDFLEEFDIGVGDGVAGFDLARFDAKGCGKGEAVLSVEGEVISK